MIEHQLAVAQKHATIGLMAAGVAHDLNNLITIIAGNAELARAEAHTGALNARLQHILDAAESAASLTRSVLDAARGSEPAEVSLAACVDRSYRLLGPVAPQGTRLALENPASDITTRVSADGIQQIIANLVINAYQAMGSSGGTVRLKTSQPERESLPNAVRRELPPGRFARLEVEDDGPGIAANVLPRIFDPFFTTKLDTRGTGLGLTVVREILRESHGYIHVTSKPGEGTRFSVFLSAVDRSTPDP